jgi:hypothetical protein
MVCASVDMQKEVGIGDFSIPFQILWLTVIYGARITGEIGYYLLGELSSCSRTSTNTHTMVPLPTILGQQSFRLKPLFIFISKTEPFTLNAVVIPQVYICK